MNQIAVSNGFRQIHRHDGIFQNVSTMPTKPKGSYQNRQFARDAAQFFVRGAGSGGMPWRARIFRYAPPAFVFMTITLPDP